MIQAYKSQGLGVNGLGASGRAEQFRLGELIQWSPLGPGGFPAMSLQGSRRMGAYGDEVTLGKLGELLEWTRLGPGGFPPGSLQGRRLGAAGDAIAISPMAMFASVVGAVALGYVAAKVMG